MYKYSVAAVVLISLLGEIHICIAQEKKSRSIPEQCATIDRLENKLSGNADVRTRFQSQLREFNKAVSEGYYNLRDRKAGNLIPGNREPVYIIPVVFHIVLTDPNLVTDAQIRAQLDTLNKSFAGKNGDSVKIPAHFKSLFGKSGIQFCLAQRNPEGNTTSGIERKTASRTSFSYTDDAVKYSNRGGLDSWNTDSYLNIWICTLSNSILGYATFPDDGTPEEQGIVIDSRSLPGGSSANYNTGKTLTHETGHFFNLYHIWGDDNGSCSGTDYVDDTPNQANSSSGCYSGIRTDNCSNTGNGIMYQNYMDYSYDNCLLMFTYNQVTRMEAALMAYRPALLNSTGCEPVRITEYNSVIASVDKPEKRICTNGFSPVVTIKNNGNLPLTTLQISSMLDDGRVVSYQWSGNLSYLSAIQVKLDSFENVSAGQHSLIIYTSNPNNQPDEEPEDDTLHISFQYYPPVNTISEGFENTSFPPRGWDGVNPDDKNTWQRVTGVGKTGNASVMIDNYNNTTASAKDDLRMPLIRLANADSAYLRFQVAAASYTPTSSRNNTWDTLEVLLSRDCGYTYKSLYKKWGSTLVTRPAATTSYFVPAAAEWRKDSVDLTSYINTGDFLLAFRNTGNNENNIYLDDINLTTITINPYLKEQGFMVTPNPTTGLISVQFYPNPAGLKSIMIFNMLGQKIAEQKIIVPATYYSFDLSRNASGIYMVYALFTNNKIVRKILKR